MSRIRLLALLTLTVAFGLARPANAEQVEKESEPGFAGRLKQTATASDAPPHPVRNDVAQPGGEISTLRYFKIRKGTFPEFLKASQEGVWPYFEKIGSRVVGMWKAIHPAVEGGAESPDFDEVYLMTRYASVAHWEASREPQKHGGNGPDWEACRKALELRASLTIETRVTFLQGDTRNSPPLFMPGLTESAEGAKPKTSD